MYLTLHQSYMYVCINLIVFSLQVSYLNIPCATFHYDVFSFGCLFSDKSVVESVVEYIQDVVSFRCIPQTHFILRKVVQNILFVQLFLYVFISFY